MSWNTPITWPVTGVSTTHMNEQLRDNMNVLHAGNGQNSVPTSINVAVGRTLDIGSTEETFNVAGSNVLAYVSTAGRLYGNRIHLIKKTNDGGIAYGQGSVPVGYGKIYANGAGSSSITWYQERMITLIFDGTAWHHDTTGT